jgi:competence protein ComEA
VSPVPDRPLPARPVSETIRAWLQWFGLVRLLVIGLAILSVGAGAFWLLRAPVTPIENSLPVAQRTTTLTKATPSGVSSGPPTSHSSPTTLDPAGPVAPLASTTTTTGSVVVDVAGAVLHPGVYALAAGSRVHQALAAAGGLDAGADIDVLNLAAPLRDGDRLYVPHSGQPVPIVVVPTGGAQSIPAVGQTGAIGPAVPAAPVDLNRASVEELDALPGVGPSTATAIVSYRTQIGPFASVDDLLKVRGIGPAKLDAIRELVAV